jgi:predicted nucleic-acid-binding Zn-ribbon protein
MEQLTVEITEKPNALFFKEHVRETLRAYICGDCGYSELYADYPKELWLSYQRFQGQKD